MKKIFIALLFIPFIIQAQITDDFEDGDILGWTESTVSRWEASSTNPLSGTYSLHHAYDNLSSGFDQISTDMTSINIGEGIVVWQFQVKYGYAAPSWK